MPRGGRSSGGGGRSARPASRPASRPPSQPAPKAPAPAQAQAGGTLLGAIADGIGWGTGTAIAHRVVDAVMGPRTFRYENVGSEAAPRKAGSDDACSVHSKAFQDCLNSYGDEIGKCQVYMNMLAECKRNSVS